MSDPSADASLSAPDGGANVLFKRKRSAPRSLRKPEAAASAGTLDALPSADGVHPPPITSDHGDQGEADSSVVVKVKRKSHNPLVQSTLPAYKRLKRDGGDLDDEGGLDLDDDEDGAGGYLSKQRQLNRFGEAGVSSRSRAVGGASEGVAKVCDDATRHSNWDLEVDDTGKAKNGAAPTSASNDASEDGTSRPSNDDGVYRGAKSYSSFVPTRDDGTSSKMRSRGPIRMSTNVRSTTLMDYQPDVCKDYKETGYCGFGDTCKFLHDRSDYLAGWELDLLPNSNRRTRGDFSDPEDGNDSEEDEIPFACLICRQPFTDPVVTNCGHYFCSACAIKRYTKTAKCFACGAQTGGLFNSATKVLKRMEEAKKNKSEERSERRRMRGYDDDAGRELLEGVEIGGAPDYP